MKETSAGVGHSGMREYRVKLNPRWVFSRCCALGFAVVLACADAWWWVWAYQSPGGPGYSPQPWPFVVGFHAAVPVVMSLVLAMAWSSERKYESTENK